MSLNPELTSDELKTLARDTHYKLRALLLKSRFNLPSNKDAQYMHDSEVVRLMNELYTYHQQLYLEQKGFSPDTQLTDYPDGLRQFFDWRKEYMTPSQYIPGTDSQLLWQKDQSLWQKLFGRHLYNQDDYEFMNHWQVTLGNPEGREWNMAHIHDHLALSHIMAYFVPGWTTSFFHGGITIDGQQFTDDPRYALELNEPAVGLYNQSPKAITSLEGIVRFDLTKH